MNIVSLRRIPPKAYLIQHADGVLGAIMEQDAKFPNLAKRLAEHYTMLYKQEIPPELRGILATTLTPGDSLHAYTINLDIQRCNRSISSFDFFLAKAFIQTHLGKYKDALQNFFNVQWLRQCGVKNMVSPKEYKLGLTRNAMKFHVAHVETEENIVNLTLQTMREIMAELEGL